MNDKTTNNATAGLILYRVNYSYIANNGAIRSGSIAVNAKDENEAREKAAALLPTFKLNHPKISGTRPY